MSTSPDPVRIAFCITDLDVGGAERALVNLVTRLDRGRWEPSVICLAGPGALVEPLEQAGIPVICLGARRAWNLAVLPRLTRELRRIRPALLQTSLYHANIAGRIAARRAGVPRVVSGIRVAERRSRFRLWADRLTDGLVDRHVCVSRAVAEFSTTHGGLPAEKVTVIPNAVDADRLARAEPVDLSQLGIPAESRILLFVGRLDRQKAPLCLLEAAELLVPDHDELHVLVVGDGPLKERLRRWVGQRGLQERIHLAGRRSDVPALMKAADCLVLPSRWEGMPNVVLEAMAVGLPVVATAVDGVAELVRDGETGLLVRPGSPSELARAVERVLAGSRAAPPLAANAQHVVKKEFTWKRVVSAYEAVYRELLAE